MREIEKQIHFSHFMAMQTDRFPCLKINDAFFYNYAILYRKPLNDLSLFFLALCLPGRMGRVFREMMASKTGDVILL